MFICITFLLYLFFIFSAAYATPLKDSTSKFIGSAQCKSCHQVEYAAWQGSHHDMAMRHAKPDSVLGNFNNFKLEFKGKQNRFFKKGELYWVNIEGPDGQFNDYQIKYTFGYQPLQQYMVEFDDGRVQLIPFAWDSRIKEDGGQRWFHLYPQFTKKHQDYFWTNSGQNWNYMCADCHSTNVKKNYDIKSNRYNTTFSEINVGCEACHGPGSNHIDWSKKPDKTKKFAGFERDLTKSVKNWVNKPNRTTLTPEKIQRSQQTLVCAQCHSRHTQISENDNVKSNEFGDRYILSLLTPQLYYPDGQIYDENFVYGSFLQSKMHKNGVVCSNCHDPHSASLTLPKEQICLQCHQAQTYQNPLHHHHQDNSAGAQCINCHMPETTYMEIDDRRDHRWHVPNPEQSSLLGTPDVCLSCHKDKDSKWSSTITQQWVPKVKKLNEKPFAPVFSAIDNGYNQASNALSQIAQSSDYAPIVRGSALIRMNTLTDTNSLIAIARAVKNENSNIRLGAISGAENISAAGRWRIISPLLADNVLVVRSEAARILMPLWQQLTIKQKHILEPALNEYIEIQDFNGDRGFAHANKAYVFINQERYDDAIHAYKESFRIEPYFAPAYLNLSELYRRQKKNNSAISVLQQGLNAIPDNGQLNHALGLAFIRANKRDKAIKYLHLSTKVSPQNSRFHYVYGLSIENLQPEKAQLAINKAFQISNNPQYLFTLCEMQIKQKSAKAMQCLQSLSEVAPQNIIKQLKQQLENNMKPKGNL